MENKLEQGRLYDFYGELLTPHQRRIYESAVYEDLSLAEIAESEGISRLKQYEEKLHMIERFDRITGMTKKLADAAQTADDPATFRKEVLATANAILKDME